MRLQEEEREVPLTELFPGAFLMPVVESHDTGNSPGLIFLYCLQNSDFVQGHPFSIIRGSFLKSQSQIFDIPSMEKWSLCALSWNL